MGQIKKGNPTGGIVFNPKPSAGLVKDIKPKAGISHSFTELQVYASTIAKGEPMGLLLTLTYPAALSFTTNKHF